MSGFICFQTLYFCHNVLCRLILSIFFIYFLWNTLGSSEIVVKLDTKKTDFFWCPESTKIL